MQLLGSRPERRQAEADEGRRSITSGTAEFASAEKPPRRGGTDDDEIPF